MSLTERTSSPAPSVTGEMGERVRTFDWSRTPLGPMDRWPQSLRTLVDMLLAHPLPMIVLWGPDLIQIYNDGYAEIAGQKHPTALGQPTRECWPEVWHFNAPLYERVLSRGESVLLEDQLFPIARHGVTEDAFFTLTYSPASDDCGRVGGVVLTVIETTARVRAERERERRQSAALAVANLGTFEWDVRTNAVALDERSRAIFGFAPGEGTRAEQVFARIHPEDFPRVFAEAQASQRGLSRLETEYRIVLPNGTARTVVSINDALPGPDGTAERMLGVFKDITERVRADEALRAVLESINDAFYAVDADFRFTYVNRKAEQLWGRRREELVGRHYWTEFPKAVGSESYRMHFKVMSERMPVQYETVSPILSRWIDVSIYPEDSGGLSCYFRDVTDRRRAEAEAARLAAMVQASRDGMFMLGLDGAIQTWNPGAQRVFGYASEEVVGRGISLMIPPDRRDEPQGLLGRVRRGEGVPETDTVRVRKDGSPVDVSISLDPVLDTEGRVVAAAATVRDITQRRRAEEALRESEERLRLALAIAQIGTFEIDLRTDAVTVNEAGREMYGWPPGEPLTFAKVQTHFHPEDREAVMRRVADAFRPGGPGEFDVEQRIVHTSGAVRWIRVRGRAIFEGAAGDARAVRCVGTYLDITRDKEAQRRREELLAVERAARAEAERASRMKDEFLATLSHELRTPLNAILGWAQILRVSGEDLAEGLATIERNARAQTQIIEDLLDMSRIISGKVRLDVQRVDLADVVRAGIDTVRPAAEAKGVRLHTALNPAAAAAGTVSGDPNRLQQVFWNLLSNAVKFTPQGGHVDVRLERVDGHVEFSVADTGEGIRPEFLPHVFDRFRQADASTTRQHGGLGLGLSIAKQLVELHGGTVRATSAGPGRGSTFVVALPLTVIHPDSRPRTDRDAGRLHPGAAALPSDLSQGACPQLDGVRVVVVDDEADARVVVRRLLEDRAASVRTAATADEAVRLVESERPDVLVSDIGMPGEDGYSLIRRVRALGPERGGNVPAVALTAYARAEDRVRAVRAGFQTHVAKPVEPAELVTMVASLAGRTGPPPG